MNHDVYGQYVWLINNTNAYNINSHNNNKCINI